MRLTKIGVKNFTVFSDAVFEFSPGLNVVVGENGAGKSHVLKIAYSVMSVLSRGERESSSSVPTKTYLSAAIAKKLRGVFRPDELGRLARRQPGVQRCEIVVHFGSEKLAFAFNTKSKSEVSVEEIPSQWILQSPAYLPTRELLTIHPNFVSLYESVELPFEETWRDTCLLLGLPSTRGRRLEETRTLLQPLEDQLEGTVVLESGRFYIENKSGKVEAHLVAEGMRKLAMIAQLIVNGALSASGTLLWDEPEANLNPKIIKRVAKTILQLSRSGIQVIVASHSLFLIRELDILLRTHGNEVTTESPPAFIGLHREPSGVQVQQGASIEDVGRIDALMEELSQSERYLESEAQ